MMSSCCAHTPSSRTPAQASFTFDGSPADFRFRGDIDHLNFSELPAGESFGMADGSLRLELHPGDEEAAPGEYFDYADGEIRLARPAVPAMLTLDDHAVRLDCLCYLMHRISSEGTLLP